MSSLYDRKIGYTHIDMEYIEKTKDREGGKSREREVRGQRRDMG